MFYTLSSKLLLAANADRKLTCERNDISNFFIVFTFNIAIMFDPHTFIHFKCGHIEAFLEKDASL